jgi:hypothetical protein
MLGGNQEQLDAFMEKFNALYNESFTDNGKEFMLSSVVGAILMQKSHDRHALSNNFVGWSVDAYVGAKLGPMAERYLNLHALLVKAGGEFSFEHCDRYGMAFANDDDFKSMALQTQNYTYMVVLCRRMAFQKGTDASVETWAIHIRRCTAGKYSTDYKRDSLKSLAFLADREAVYPDIGYGDNANDYFRYKDGRDRGYMVTVEPDFVFKGQPTYTAKDAIYGFGFLEQLTYDLASHCDCLETYEEYIAEQAKV